MSEKDKNIFIAILWTVITIVICGLIITETKKYYKISEIEKQCIYETGYLHACKDFYHGRISHLYIKAWDNKIAKCPKCGSMRIIGNIPRDRGVIIAYICLDCGYTWKRK